MSQLEHVLDRIHHIVVNQQLVATQHSMIVKCFKNELLTGHEDSLVWDFFPKWKYFQINRWRVEFSVFIVTPFPILQWKLVYFFHQFNTIPYINFVRWNSKVYLPILSFVMPYVRDYCWQSLRSNLTTGWPLVWQLNKLSYQVCRLLLALSRLLSPFLLNA